MRRATLDLLLGLVLALLATVGVAATTPADAVAYGYDGAAGTHVAAPEGVGSGVASPLGSAEVAESRLASVAGRVYDSSSSFVAPSSAPSTAVRQVGDQQVLVHNSNKRDDDDACGVSAPNSSRGLFDVRSPNPAHPPLDDVTSTMQRRYHPNCDCSEIAQDLLEASGGQGRIVRYEPQKGSVLRTPEAGGARIEDYVYHEVFTDGRYVYDPLFGPTPVPKGDYDRMIRGLNPGARGG